MKITYPHMGYLSTPLNTMLTGLGLEVVTVPPITKRTVELGTLNSPEGVCLPYKITMGNFIEGLEIGADTIITMCGPGKCRFGFYNTVQKIALAKGRDHVPKVISIDSNRLFPSLYNVLTTCTKEISRLKILKQILLALKTLKSLDSVNCAKNYYGARSDNPTQIFNIYEQTIKSLANCHTFQQVNHIHSVALTAIKSYSNEPKIPPLRVGLVGEFYLLMEPFVNHKIENLLVTQGVEVKKFIYTGHWAYANTILRTLGLHSEEHEYLKKAQPYMNYHVGGDGLKTVGGALWCAQNHYDGIIHLFPFGCMPEIVAQYSLKKLVTDYNLPMLSLSIDEHASDVGLLTRIEAFVDCLKRKKTLRV